MILIMRDKTAVKQAKRIGGSLMLPLTGYVKENRFYKVIMRSEKEITITQIEI